MKKNFTVKDCTKENFEKSLDMLKDAQKAIDFILGIEKSAE